MLQVYSLVALAWLLIWGFCWYGEDPERWFGVCTFRRRRRYAIAALLAPVWPLPALVCIFIVLTRMV